MDSKAYLNNVLTDDQISSRSQEAKSQLYHYTVRSDSLLKRSPVLQKSYTQSTDPKFGAYIDTEAILYIRELQDCGVSLPSWQDMITVGGETDLRLFLQIGRSCYDVINKYLPNKSEPLRILDFGVGCGRTARHFFRYIEQYEIHGCDVDAAPIEYLREKVPLIQPLLSSNEPPLPYNSNYFDAIYSVSVFSHLNQSSFVAWAEDLSRIMQLGGILVITIHGLHALDILRHNKRPDSIGIDGNIFRTAESNFEHEGFIWMPQATGSGDIDTNQYGISFVDKKRLLSYLPKSLKVIHYGEGEIGNWQDLVVIQKI